MPSVPTYEAFQVPDRSLPDVRQQRDTSAGLFEGNARQVAQLGNALSDAGQGLGAVVREMQDRQNADMLFRAETALKTDYLDYEASARERRGQSAWGITKDTGAWFDKSIQKHLDGLENDAQKALFRQTAEKLRLQSLDQFRAYESAQRRASLDESAQASIVSSINLAAATAARAPKGVAGENGFVQSFDVAPQKADILKRVQALAQINGWSPEMRAAKEQEYLTNFHKQVIQSRLDTDPAGAKAYFDANKGEIAGAEHDTIGRALKVGGLKETAQGFADQVAATGMTEMDALKAAREKFSGEEEAAVVGEIKTRFAESSQARERAQRDASDQAWKIYSQTHRVGAIPASVLAQMDGKDVEALRTHARVVAEGHAVKTDPNTYLDLREMARDNPQAFKALDLRRYIGKLSTSDLQEFATLQGNVEKLKDAATLDAQLSSMHDQLNWGTGDADRQKKGAFDKAVADTINEEQKTRGKTLSYEERQKIIDRMAIEGEVLSGAWYTNDPNKRFYEVAGTPDAAKFAPKVSDADRQTIIERFKTKQKRTPSDAEVMQIYRNWKGL